MQINNPSHRIVAYNLLGAEEKSATWKKHLEEAISTKVNLNSEQKDFISEMINFIQPKFFSSFEEQFIGIIAQYEFRAKKCYLIKKALFPYLMI